MKVEKKQTKYSDIQNKLRHSVQRLYDIPDYGQVDLNLVNMANFFPLLENIIDSFRPKIICEIGSDLGMTSDLLYQYCSALGARLHVVDPALGDNRVSDSTVTYFRKMSIPYLEEAEPADVYFVDGDHNFYTVLNELRLIREKNQLCGPRLIFLHDVSWPCGYMDMYYDIDSIKQNFRKEAVSGLNVSVLSSSHVTGKQGLPIDEVAIAIEDGGEANGVLAAVEKFIEESSGWKYFSIPSIYGLGVLYYTKGVPKEILRKVEQLSRDFKRFKKFLSILELNRILLLEKMEETGEIWKQQNDFIQAQTTLVANFRLNIKALEEKCEAQGREWKAQNDLIKALEEKREAQGREWKAQNDLIQAQTTLIADLRLNIKALEEKCEVQGREWKEQADYIQVQAQLIQDLRANCQALEEKCGEQGKEWNAQRQYIDELIRRNVNLDLKIMELESLKGMVRSILKRLVKIMRRG